MTNNQTSIGGGATPAAPVYGHLIKSGMRQEVSYAASS